jgi:predicted metal-dependent hydrolase
MSHAPVPRAPDLTFEGVPKRWLAGSTAATHIANGVNLLFPAGERFFVRSVKHYLNEVSPELALEVRGFFGQEGRHAQAHERFFDALRGQGYDVDAILERYERLAYEKIERSVSPRVSLAVTVALEHFTAILAEDALTDELFQHMDERVRQLLEWHAMEELEHKAVAFDVLAEVSPGYGLRMLGLALATASLAGFWLMATGALLRQDGMSLRDAVRDLAKLRSRARASGHERLTRPVFLRVFARGIVEYVRPGFHPNDRDHGALVERTLERLRTEGVLAAA